MKNESSRFQLLGGNLPRNVLEQIVQKCTSQKDAISSVACSEGHRLVDELVPKMSAALFNLFAGNMVKERSSDVHAKKKKIVQ